MADKVMTNEMKASSEFDVVLTGYELQDNPATLTLNFKVGDKLTFYSKIKYESIHNWGQVWGSDLQLRARLLGILSAWDAMRFLALGGTKLTLPNDIVCSEQICRLWTFCFLRQFGEWRYRNLLRYNGAGPKLEAQHTTLFSGSNGSYPRISSKSLLTNGGGKDTLASFILLKESGIECDFYQGYLPLGGKVGKQKELLDGLSKEFAKEEQKIIEVSIEDNFFNRTPEEFQNAGVKVKHYHADFAVGHTANYVGYFPIILSHGYERIFFNIERSADTPMATWHGEPINHQWTKSAEYQSISTSLFEIACGKSAFKGFESTLRGLYDLSIYHILRSERELLSKTHSCNYGKPWCRQCAKCCFCYLMMSAFFDEEYAKKVTGAKESLFSDPECLPAWESILDRNKVAWDCVPSHEECLIAVDHCLKAGMSYPLLEKFKATSNQVEDYERKYSEVSLDDMPIEIHIALIKRLNAD